MKKNDFILAVASALEVEKGLITMDLKIDDIPEWDSLGHLTILSHLDDITDGKAGEIIFHRGAKGIYNGKFNPG